MLKSAAIQVQRGGVDDPIIFIIPRGTSTVYGISWQLERKFTGHGEQIIITLMARAAFDQRQCFILPHSVRLGRQGVVLRNAAAAGESEKDEERRPPPWRACCRPQSVLMAVTLIQFQHISWITAKCMWLSIFFSAGNWHRGGGLRCVYSPQQQSSSSSINSHHHRPDFLFFASFNASNWIDFSGWCLT